jgi:ATP-dependent exoDNAse (exonuclease V) alpha subunit
MAIYVLNMKTLGRANGSSAPSAIAYRAGERIRDERTGRTYDHSARQDVLHKEILVPSKFADAPPEWTHDRSTLWNAAEAAESRKNARVAREFMVALPAELSHAQRVALVRGFSQELADRHGFAIDVAVHAPRPGADRDPRNFHAHLLATTRTVTAEGLGAKTPLELNDANRLERGLEPFVSELIWTRERWATMTNEALREAQLGARVDHRTLAAQGIDREPAPQLPRSVLEIERRGERSEVAERIRAEHAERAQARGAARAPSLEDIRREAREAWLKSRQEAQLGDTASHGPSHAAEQPPGDDFSR